MRAPTISAGILLVAILSSCDGFKPPTEVQFAEPQTSLASSDDLAWEGLASLPVAVRAASGDTDGSRIYVFGGAFSINEETDATQIYDPTTDSWSLGAPLNPTRAFNMAGTLGDGIHVVGGFGVAQMADHVVYDPSSDSWSFRAPLPVPDHAGVAEVVDGKLYVITFTALHIYDPATDSWTAGTPRPTQAISPASAVIDNRIYVAGGQTAGINTTDAVHRYDPSTNAWETLAPLPGPREALGGGAVGGHFCVFGGRLARAFPSGVGFPETHCYEPGANSWQRGPDMITPRVEIASVELDGAIYAIGGRVAEDNFENETVERLVLAAVVVDVEIDIKPGGEENSINLSSKGFIPVAVLTTPDFDASTIDPATVTLGNDDGSDTPVAEHKNGSLRAHLEDVDEDGDLDLLLQFKTQALVENGDLDEQTTELILNGETDIGRAIKGRDIVRIVPAEEEPEPSFALQFDGAQGTETPDHEDLDLTSTFTIECWIKPFSPSGFGGQTIIAKWGLSVAASYGIGIDNDGRLHLVNHDPAQDPNNTKIFGSSALAAGVWQHFAFVFDYGQAWLYVDGVLDTSCGGALGNCWNGNTGTKTVPYMNTPQVTTSLVTLGRCCALRINYYRGLLDEVRTWNVARSQSEIQADMNRTLTGSESGLVACWRMDEGSGDVAFDATGRGHDMQLGDAVGPDGGDPTWVSPGKL